MKVNEQRAKLYELMGDLPERDAPISVQHVSSEQRDGYLLENLVLDLNGIERVPAYFTRPINSQGKLPTIIYNHAHGGRYEIGKDELLSGRGAINSRPYAGELADAGYAAICIDTWAFGKRRGMTESEIFKKMLWHGQVLWGMMVYDSIRVVDYVISRDDVDADRVGTLGISMGSTMGWWLAAVDERIKVCVDTCCLTDFDALMDIRNLDGHGIYYYVPSLLKHFSAGDINALIAPRAHLSLAGIYDKLTPPAGLDRIDEQLKAVYAQAGASDQWRLSRYECGHMETHAMRREIMDFLREKL